MIRANPGMTVAERLERLSVPEPNSGCLLWLGAEYSYGYGLLVINHRKVGAHRAAWESARGPIPAGLCVCHRCDVRMCINPDHLFLGTSADNTADMIAKNRQAKGSKTRPETRAKGDRNGARLHPERLARGDRNGHATRPEMTPRGENHPSARLTAEQVREIRSLRGLMFQKNIAEKFGISQATVSAIQLNQIWKTLIVTERLFH